MRGRCRGTVIVVLLEPFGEDGVEGMRASAMSGTGRLKLRNETIRTILNGL